MGIRANKNKYLNTKNGRKIIRQSAKVPSNFWNKRYFFKGRVIPNTQYVHHKRRKYETFIHLNIYKSTCVKYIY